MHVHQYFALLLFSAACDCLIFSWIKWISSLT
jgi:hypothetical protein